MNRGMINLVVAVVLAVILSAAILYAGIKVCGLMGLSLYAYREYMGIMTIGLTYFIKQVL